MTQEQKTLLADLKGYEITVTAKGVKVRPNPPEDLAAAARKHKRLVLWATLREAYAEAVSTVRGTMKRLDEGTATVDEFNRDYDRTAAIEQLARHHGVEDLIPDVLHGKEGVSDE